MTNLNDIYIAFRFNTYSDGTANVTGKFWKLKLERGNNATDWTPAPEDSLESVDVEILSLYIANIPIGRLLVHHSSDMGER